MKRLLALGALILAGSIGNAEATTINFEDLAVAPGTDHIFDVSDPISGGFLFDAANHSHITNSVWGTDNGSTHLVLDDFFGADPTTFSQVGSAPFALSSIDISEANARFFSAGKIEVTGNLFGGGTIFSVLALDNNLVDGVTANYFETFTFDAGWGNLSSVMLNGVGAAGGGNYYAIDNVVVNTAVPEPGSLSLFSLGSAFLFGLRRRIRR